MMVVSGKARAERGDVGDLPVVAPGLEGELPGREQGEAGAEVVPQEHALGRPGAVVGHRLVGVPGRAQADAAEAAAPRRDLRVEHRGRGGAQPELRGAHDPGRDARRAVEPGGAHRRDAVHELGLPIARRASGPSGLEHRAALDERR
jgi:hypothetical protein